MKQQIIFIAYLCSAALVYALPISDNAKELDVINIPLSNGKELDVLTLGTSDTMNERNKRTIGILRDLFPEISKLNGGDNSIDLSALNQQLEETIRVARQTNLAENSLTETGNNQVTPAAASNDQQASESKAPAIDELTLDSLEDADGEDRNKRQGFLGQAFAGSSGGGGATGGGAGSGNFLFDIIRRTADRAARAVGTVYRVVAGTENFDVNDKSGSFSFTKIDSSPDTNGLVENPTQNKYDRTARTINDGLFSGSVQSQSPTGQQVSDGGEVDEDGEPKPSEGNDGYTEGIPGPVTRLVVLANRGLANLIQDLILRIASTSERLVNFKARLITALI